MEEVVIFGWIILTCYTIWDLRFITGCRVRLRVILSNANIVCGLDEKHKYIAMFIMTYLSQISYRPNVIHYSSISHLDVLLVFGLPISTLQLPATDAVIAKTPHGLSLKLAKVGAL